MKKKTLNLARKLVLQKQTITTLDNGQQNLIAGGATLLAPCSITCPGYPASGCPAITGEAACEPTNGCPATAIDATCLGTRPGCGGC